MPSIFSSDRLTATLGNDIVTLQPIGAQGAVRIAPDGPTIRPLSFGERGRLLVDSMPADDPVGLAIDLLASAATGVAPGDLFLSVKAIALALAGAEIVAPSLSATAAMAVRLRGWTLDALNAQPAIQVDRIVLESNAQVAGGWNKIVFASPQKVTSAKELVHELAARLVNRVDPDYISLIEGNIVSPNTAIRDDADMPIPQSAGAAAGHGQPLTNQYHGEPIDNAGAAEVVTAELPETVARSPMEHTKEHTHVDAPGTGDATGDHHAFTAVSGSTGSTTAQASASPNSVPHVVPRSSLTPQQGRAGKRSHTREEYAVSESSRERSNAGTNAGLRSAVPQGSNSRNVIGKIMDVDAKTISTQSGKPSEVIPDSDASVFDRSNAIQSDQARNTRSDRQPVPPPVNPLKSSSRRPEFSSSRTSTPWPDAAAPKSSRTFPPGVVDAVAWNEDLMNHRENATPNVGADKLCLADQLGLLLHAEADLRGLEE